MNFINHSRGGKALFAIPAALALLVIVPALNGQKAPRVLTGHTSFVSAVAVTPDGARIVSGGKDGVICVWDAASGTLTGSMAANADVLSLALSPDGSRVYAGLMFSLTSEDRVPVKCFDIASGALLASYGGIQALPMGVAISPDDTLLAGVGGGSGVILWDVQERCVLSFLKGHTSQVTSVRFSPDGKTVYTGSGDGTVKSWDATARPSVPMGLPELQRSALIMRASVGALKTANAHKGGVKSIAISPNGALLVSGGVDKLVCLRDAREFTELRTLPGHTDVVFSVAVSPDGKRVLSGSQDKTVRLWDAGSGKELAVYSGHEAHVYSVCFTPDGRYAISGSMDRTVRIWELPPP
jgi:WD40 repeat protein